MLEKFRFKEELKLPTLFLTIPLFFISILWYTSTIQLHVLNIWSLTFPPVSFICYPFIVNCKQIFFNLILRSRWYFHSWIVSQVRWGVKLVLSRCYIFSSMHNVSCHCFCIICFFIFFVLSNDIHFSSTFKPFTSSNSTCEELGSVTGLLVSFLGKLTTPFAILLVLYFPFATLFSYWTHANTLMLQVWKASAMMVFV